MRTLLVALILLLGMCLAVDITLICANAQEVRPGSDTDKEICKDLGNFEIHYTDNTVVKSEWVSTACTYPLESTHG